MTSDGWTLSRHAEDRIREMQLNPYDVLRCLKNPVRISESDRYEGEEVRHYGDFALAVDPDTKTVITALWNRDIYGRWQADNEGKPRPI